MFRTSNCSSSEGLYRQLTVFFHAFYEDSGHWHDTIDNNLFEDYVSCNCALIIQLKLTNFNYHCICLKIIPL
jgi:hypothetical protein